MLQIYKSLLLFSVIICIFLLIYILYFSKNKFAKLLALQMALLTLFTTSSYIEFLQVDIRELIFWRNIGQIGIVFSVPMLLIFVIIFVGKESKLSPVMLGVIFISPVIDLVLKWTDLYHHLIRKSILLINGQLEVIQTPISLALKLVDGVTVVISLLILAWFYRKAEKPFKKQAIGIFISILLPTIVEALKIFNHHMIDYLPPTALITTATSAFMVLVIFKYQLFSIIPVAMTTLVNSIREGIIVFDGHGKLVECNETVSELFGDTMQMRNEFNGNTVVALLSKWPNWENACSEMKAAEVELEVVINQSKRYLRVSVHPLYKNNHKCGTVSIVYDQTMNKIREGELVALNVWSKKQLKELTGELLDQKKQLETILNTISDMAIISICDHKGNFMHYSDVGSTYFSDAFDKRVGETYRSGVYFYPDGKEIQLVDMPAMRALRGEKISNFHFVKKSDRGEIHFLVNGTPVMNEDKQLSYIVFFTVDITEQIEYQKLLELTAQKDKLFSAITHDIRDPLASVINLTELLSEEKEYYSKDLVEILASVQSYVQSTFGMVDNLLEWFKTQREGLVHNPITININEVIEEVLHLYSIKASTKNIYVSCEVPTDLTVHADKEMLGVVLRNIISNAIKFTPKDGIIRIKGQPIENQVRISVQDTGIGMDKEQVKRILSQTQFRSQLGTEGEKGIGLGLVVCQEIMGRNGGKLWAESIIGEGSTFFISVPR